MNLFHSRWKASLAAGFLTAVITAGVLYLQVQRTQAKITEMRRTNDAQSLKLLQQATSTAQTTTQLNEVSPGASLDRASKNPTLAQPVSVAVYRNEGQATPVATLQSFAWACDQGDVELVAKLLTFDPDSRAKVAAYLAQLPAAQRTQWASPEHLAATVCIGGFLRSPYPPAEAIALATEEPIGPHRIRLRLPGTALDGGIYQKTAEGWKYLIPREAVEQRLKALGQTISSAAK